MTDLLGSIALWSKVSKKGTNYFSGKLTFETEEGDTAFYITCFNTNKKKETSTDIHGLVNDPEETEDSIGSIFLWQSDNQDVDYDYSGSLLMYPSTQHEYRYRLELTLNKSKTNEKAPDLRGYILEHKSTKKVPVKKGISQEKVKQVDLSLDEMPF